MFTFLAQRLVLAAVTLVLATVLTFVVIQLPPGDFVTYMIGQSGGVGGVTSLADRLREQYGLDRSVPEQYFVWLGGLLHGDLGYSFLYRRPAAEIVLEELPWTLVITVLSMAFAWLVGGAIGIYSAVRKYTFGDYAFTTLGFVGLSIPNFFLAMILVYVTIVSGSGITGGLFSREFQDAPWSLARFTDLLRHLWIPVVAIGTASMAEVQRISRGNMLEVLNADFLRTARSKGLRERSVVLKHALRHAINPLISLAGMQAPRLISGIVVTAVVLDLPVIGPTFLEALRAQDMYLAGAYLLIMVVLLVIGNTLADLALAWSDPRIRY